MATALGLLSFLPVKAPFLQYPTLNLTDVTRAQNISEAMQRSGLWSESVPYSEVEDCLPHLEMGTQRTRANFASRMRVLVGMVQAGKFWDETRDAERLCPMRALDIAGPVGFCTRVLANPSLKTKIRSLRMKKRCILEDLPCNTCL